MGQRWIFAYGRPLLLNHVHFLNCAADLASPVSLLVLSRTARNVWEIQTFRAVLMEGQHASV